MASLGVFKDGFELKTIAYLLRKNDEGNNQILLALHRKQGKWNSAGGKVGDKEDWKNETIEEGMIREVIEELGVKPIKYVKRGVIDFVFYQEEKETKVSGNVFFVSEWEGEIEAKEMDKPTWFDIDKLPWDGMWSTDKLWLEPLIQSERFLEAEYEFGKQEDDHIAKPMKFVWK